MVAGVCILLFSFSMMIQGQSVMEQVGQILSQKKPVWDTYSFFYFTSHCKAGWEAEALQYLDRLEELYAAHRRPRYSQYHCTSVKTKQ